MSTVMFVMTFHNLFLKIEISFFTTRSLSLSRSIVRGKPVLSIGRLDDA